MTDRHGPITGGNPVAGLTQRRRERGLPVGGEEMPASRIGESFDYGEELTAEMNRRRINALRTGEAPRGGGHSELPGEARNAGHSDLFKSDQGYKLRRKDG